MPSCVAVGCNNKSDKKSPGVTFHSFPSEPEIRDKWVRAVRRENWTPTKYSKVCSEHFREADVDRTSLSCVRIRVGAVPSIFEGFLKYMHSKNLKERRHVKRKILRLDGDEDDELYLDESPENRPESPVAPVTKPIFTYDDDMVSKEPQVEIKDEPEDPIIERVTGAAITENTSMESMPLESARFDDSDAENLERNNLETGMALRDCTSLENVAVDSTAGDQDWDRTLEATRMAIKVIKTLKLCHVCCSKEVSLSYFNDDSCPENFPEITLVDMLNMYLPIQIEADAEFPLQVCDSCIDVLCKWHELFITCKAAHNALKNVYHREMEEFQEGDSPSSSPEKTSTADEGIGESELNPESTLNSNSSPQDEGDFCGNKSPTLDNEPGEMSNVLFQEEKENIVGYRVFNAQGTKIGVLPAFMKSCRWCGESFISRKRFQVHSEACSETSAVCDMCGKVISKRRLLPKHNKLCHGVKIVCDICGEITTRSKLTAHKEYVHFPEELSCYECCRIYRTKSLYNQHVKLHEQGKIKGTLKVFDDGESMYGCPVCRKTFDEKLSLLKHLVEPKGLRCSRCRTKLVCERSVLVHKCKEFHCPYCSKTHYNKMLLSDHIRHHTGEKPYICEICDYRFRTYTLLRFHRRSHRPPSYECKYCAKKLKSKVSLKRHENSHEGVYKYPCSDCSKQYTSPAALAKHSRHHMTIENLPSYECKYCFKILRSTVSLKRHLDLHEGIYKYPCNKCPKKYASSASLHIHARNHHLGENGPSYECKHCSKKLRSAITLKRHLNMHAGIYKYPCSRCPKKYTNSGALAKHTRCHEMIENIPTYECKYCSKKLKSKVSLERHVNSHEGVFKYSCSKCPKKYTNPSALAKHVRVHTTSGAIPKHIVVLQL